mgnify:CR=1 FL=1
MTTNLSDLFDPRCSQPLFMIDNGTIASKCGRNGGYVLSFILTIVLIIFCSYKYYNSDKIIDPNDSTYLVQKIYFI